MDSVDFAHQRSDENDAKCRLLYLLKETVEIRNVSSNKGKKTAKTPLSYKDSFDPAPAPAKLWVWRPSAKPSEARLHASLLSRLT